MTVSEDEFFRQRGFGQKIGFGERPALIIIDIVKAFTDATRMLGANLDSQIQAIRPLLEVAHERGFPVLFSTVRYEERDLRDAGLWGHKMKGSATLAADGDGWEIDPRLEVRPADSLLFNVRIQENNLFGRGQRLVLNGDVGSVRRNIILSFTEPYFRGTPLTVGFDAFSWRLLFEEFARAGTGGSIQVTYPVSAFGWTSLWGIPLDEVRIGAEKRI